MTDEREAELVARIAHFWSEWTDDLAPMRERTAFRLAAEEFLRRFEVSEKSST